MNKYLIIDQNDNVAVALKDIFKGEIVHNITLKSNIKVGHKFALKNMQKGENIIKYGYPIGHAKSDIEAGAWVHSHNLETNLNSIEKYEFCKVFEKINSIKEENVMFITNPGRMYDEDGTTFIIKNDNEFIIYRISGWMYGDRDDNYISLEDTFKIFPEWEKRWHNSQDEQLKNKDEEIFIE